MTDRLAGKVAIVTGAGSRGEGIGNGKAASILFAREGASVVCADQVASRAEETVATITAEGGTAWVFEGDVSHRDGCQRLADAAVERYGRLDILQNNVGIPSAQNLEEITEEAWDHLMGVNVRSMVLAAQAAVPHMSANGGGAIINISSVDGVHHQQSGSGRSDDGAGRAVGRTTHPRELHRSGPGLHPARGRTTRRG